MNFNPKLTVGLLFVVLASISVSNAQQGAAKPPPLRMIHFRGDMAPLLAQLAQDYGVTIGLETDPKKPTSDVMLDLKGATLPDLLNGIVQSEPRYQWRESGGNIEVFPASGSNQILDIPVTTFQVKEVGRREAIDQLMSLPEVQAVMISMNLKLRPGAPPRIPAKDEKFSLSLSGVTIRQTLNRIAGESGVRFWLFRNDNDGFFYVGPD